MYSEESMKLVLGICADIVSKNTKEDAALIINNLIPWAGIGATPRTLNCIAKGFGKKRVEPADASYDEEVNKCISELYGCASEDSYKLELLNAGLRAKRGKEVIRKLLEHDIPDRSVIDLVMYVQDARWSDEWVDRIRTCYNHSKTAKRSDYDVISYFTPEHSPETFYETCVSLGDSTNDTKMPLGWLRDIGWSPYNVKNVIWLLKTNTDFDWLRYVNPMTCSFVYAECSFNPNRMTVERITEIVEFWKNISPKLEFDLEDKDDSLCGEDRRNQYLTYKQAYNCDGDELASHIHGNGKYDDETLRRSSIWSSKTGAVGFENAMSKMTGG